MFLNVLLIILIVVVFAFTLFSIRDTHNLFREAVLTKSSHDDKAATAQPPPLPDGDKELAPVHVVSDDMIFPGYDAVQQRDHAVLSNPLYPPLNRQPMPEYDTYRLLGYVVNEESRDDTWHLYGRKRNNHQGDFYLRPSDKNTDLKIPLTNDMLNTRYSRLRDIYTLPENLIIEHPLFQGQQYTVVEYPQNNFDSIYF